MKIKLLSKNFKSLFSLIKIKGKLLRGGRKKKKERNKERNHKVGTRFILFYKPQQLLNTHTDHLIL